MKKIIVAMALVALLAAGCNSKSDDTQNTPEAVNNANTQNSPASSDDSNSNVAPSENESAKTPAAKPVVSSNTNTQPTTSTPKPTNTNTNTTTNTPASNKITMADVKAANTAQKCWTVVNGSVYNMTPFINQHPGGSSRIISMCGKDSTSAYVGQHGGQNQPEKILASYKIGPLSN